MLYRCTDDVKRLQKVVADTERRFADCLRQIKMLGKEKGSWEKELEIFKEAAQELVDMVDPPEEGETSPRPLLE
jgi:hypothetical protein